jgi:hypothetical protein
MASPAERVVPCFAAEPPQELLPYGRWAETLRAEFLRACLEIETEDGEELGEPGEVHWHPDRTWHGRTFVGATARTSTDLEVYGVVSFVPGGDDHEPSDFHAVADYTADTADAHPDWQVDLCDEVVGRWRGEQGKVAAMTLVWGRPLVPGARIATAELADLVVDQCPVVDGRFALLAPDDYRGDTIEVVCFDGSGKEIARESLYADDEG